MKRKFEAHVTLPRENYVMVKATGDVFGWSFSAIDGDPVMGKRAYCYLTAYADDAVVLLNDTKVVSNHLVQAGVEVLREKVEEIVYDTKTGHDVINGEGAS